MGFTAHRGLGGRMSGQKMLHLVIMWRQMSGMTSVMIVTRVTSAKELSYMGKRFLK
jgi:hypothetical protein